MKDMSKDVYVQVNDGELDALVTFGLLVSLTVGGDNPVEAFIGWLDYNDCVVLKKGVFDNGKEA